MIAQKKRKQSENDKHFSISDEWEKFKFKISVLSPFTQGDEMEIFGEFGSLSMVRSGKQKWMTNKFSECT